MVLVVASASEAEAVMPTSVPAAAFSAALAAAAFDVADCPHIELVDIGHADRERLRAEAAVRRSRPHHDAVTGRSLAVQRRLPP